MKRTKTKYLKNFFFEKNLLKNISKLIFFTNSITKKFHKNCSKKLKKKILAIFISIFKKLKKNRTKKIWLNVG